MYYNAETDRALQSLDQKAAENRAYIKNAVPLVAQLPKVWSVTEGRWVINPSY